MRLRVPILISLAAACSFEASVDGVDAGTSSDAQASIDAAPSTDAAVTLDAAPQVVCTSSDPSLRLCIEFEDPTLGIALDGSGLENHASVAGVTSTTRAVPATSQAVGVTASTEIMIPDTADFDLQTLTMTAWVQRTALPDFDERFGVIDVGQRQAALAIDDLGRVTCFVKTSSTLWFRTGGSTGNGEWALAACTYDAPRLCAWSFRNGSSTPDVVCGNTNSAPLDTSASSGSTIGALLDSSSTPSSRFSGNIDSVRIYSRALSEAELCMSGGLSGC